MITEINTATAPSGRIDALGWDDLAGQLNELGCALTEPVLAPAECAEIAALYADDDLFRATIDMEPRRFGRGQYRYFADPRPGRGRRAAGVVLAASAAGRAGLGRQARPLAPWPDTFDEWLDQCHADGQQRPTPLLLSYGPGDWNALHQDLYGKLYFPMQVVIGLDAPGTDYAGGEFLLVEQRPRAQSRGTVTALGQGQALIFTTSERPVPSSRGWSASPVRHGVSVVRSGKRMTLGLVLHDAT